MQQFVCTSNAELQGPETKKTKKGTIKQTQQLSCTSHERTINNSTKTDQKLEKK